MSDFAQPEPLPPTRSVLTDVPASRAADRDPFRTVKTGTLGMTVFLISLSTLFAASMVGWFIMAWIMRNRTTRVDEAGLLVEVPPMPDLPPLPALLWLSTAVILLSSVTIQWAKSSIRRGGQGGLRFGMALTLLLGLAFLGIQTLCWFQWVEIAWNVMSEEHDAYTFAATGFLVLSGLHAAHVVGGLVPMLVVTARSLSGRYSADHHAGVAHLAMYWHFLDVVWLILFAGLLVA